MQTETQKNWNKHFDNLEKQKNTKDYYQKKFRKFKIHPVVVILLLVVIYSLIYYSKHSGSVNERIEVVNADASGTNGNTLADSIDTINSILDKVQKTVDPVIFDRYISQIEGLKFDDSYNKYVNAVTAFIQYAKYNEMTASEYNNRMIKIYDILEEAFKANDIKYERTSKLSISYLYLDY